MADAGQALTDTLRQLGVDSLTLQPATWRGALRDRLPGRPGEAALLITALDAGVPRRLSTEPGGGDVDAMASQLARAYGLSPQGAHWAVRTWAQALNGASVAPAPSDRPTAAGRDFGGDATVLRPPTSAFTAAPPPRFDAAPPPGAHTVLRAEPAAGYPGTAPEPVRPTPPPSASPGKRGGRSRLIVVVGVVVLVAIIAGVALFVLRDSGDPGDQTAAPAFAAISPVLAHRGDHDGYPQETLPAFVQAADRGFTVETDVRWTKDDVPIITHDFTTGRGMVCRGGPLAVSHTRWAVLRSRCRTSPADAKTHRSYGIPTFATVVEQLSRIRGATLFAEIKVEQTPAQSKQYLAILRKWKMLGRTVATSYVDDYLDSFGKEVTREGVKIRTLRFASADAPTTLAGLRRTHVWGALFEQGWDRTPALVADARRAGIHVGVITLTAQEGPTQWAAAKKLGTQFVLTDRPSAYDAWLAKH